MTFVQDKTGLAAPPTLRKKARLARLNRKFAKVCLAVASFCLTALLLDFALMTLELFPPKYRRGDSKLGFAPSSATGPTGDHSALPEFAEDPASGTFHVNSAGFMTQGTMDQFLLSGGPKIVALGDSHTALEYCFPQTHMGVLESELKRRGYPQAAVLGAGKGRFSPLQEWLLYDERLHQLPIDLVIVNFYTGNDFYDLIRTDDRPSLVAHAQHGYSIVPPQFVVYLAPGDHSYWAESRLIYAGHLLLQQAGLGDAWAKFQHARSACNAFGVPLSGSWRYLSDLNRSREPSLWYSAAVAAQALNQSLFFHHFPGSLEESLARTRFVLQQMRAAYPTQSLILSPIPSRLLACPDDRDPASEKIFARLPIDRGESVALEQRGYDALLTMATEAGWHVLDTLPHLRAAGGNLYFDSDWHLAPDGSKVVGTVQADFLIAHPELFE